MEKKPEYQISASVNEVILEIILTGEVVESAVKNMQNEVTDHRQRRWLVLVPERYHGFLLI